MANHAPHHPSLGLAPRVLSQASYRQVSEAYELISPFPATRASGYDSTQHIKRDFAKASSFYLIDTRLAQRLDSSMLARDDLIDHFNLAPQSMNDIVQPFGRERYRLWPHVTGSHPAQDSLRWPVAGPVIFHASKPTYWQGDIRLSLSDYQARLHLQHQSADFEISFSHADLLSQPLVRTNGTLKLQDKSYETALIFGQLFALPEDRRLQLTDVLTPVWMQFFLPHPDANAPLYGFVSSFQDGYEGGGP